MSYDYRTNRGYNQTLNNIIDNIFTYAEATDMSCKDLAAGAQLGYQTILNLRSRKTRMPRFTTIYGLAHAVGLGVEMRKAMGRARLRIRRAG